MQVELLGTGGFHPNSRRQTACFLIPELNLLFDAGTAAFRVGPRLQSDELDVYLTHAHLDHIVGLTYLLVPVLSGQLRRLTIHATARTLEAVQQHLFAEAVFPVEPFFDTVEIPAAGAAVLARGVVLQWQPLPSHPGESMAYRLDMMDSTGTPRSMAYVTDTQVDGTYTEFIRDVNLLIHECNFSDEHPGLAAKTGHSCSGDVARIASEANVGHLVLVHMNPYQEEDDPVGLPAMSAVFPNVQVGEDETKIDF